MSEQKQAAIYVRVSTRDQNPEMQEVELQEYCKRRGWDCFLYRDKSQSGAKQDRPALNSLLSDLRKRKLDVILVWSLDRLARSLLIVTLLGAEAFHRELKERGTSVRAWHGG